jgi:hypothetical protein
MKFDFESLTEDIRYKLMLGDSAAAADRVGDLPG